ncbi:MupG family TIM beta-alpha barrel fold protein [Acidianus manzaensis]|uniref:6-phospho-N-acetylmuramidase N-terminal domain-containing protein n=1 Tax=Acidianus manzaensis TaxID=282676 RepID=A0A1W6JZ24_9CREN|nr:MupG family TIM beta-alpha barrel fold protein [Acidianus manzaensis]ARM75497.1 hypothetical protein B6F84_05255 [Acidianus manzaensis]
MASIGFSVFPGWKEIFERQKEMIIKGENLGYTEIFFGIGRGVHTKSTLEAASNAKQLLKIANKLGYYSFVDINPDILNELGASPRNMGIFKEIGFSAVRVDYGFKIDDILKIQDIGIEINPYEFPLDRLEYFLDKIDDPERVKACHNYYPSKGSGISLKELIEKSKPFVELDIPVAAFISVPSVKSDTTVEELREKDPSESAKILFDTGVISRVLIGDANPTDEEMEKLSSIKITF